MHRSVAAGVLVVAAVACSPSIDGSTATTATTAPSTGTADTTQDSTATADDEPPPVVVPDGPPVVDGVANGLVLVLDQDGGDRALVTYQADGTEVTSYVADGTFVWQPIWSPDGRRIAWAQSSDAADWELVTSSVDGTDRTTHALPGLPDYLTYDPTSSLVLALTPSPAGFGLVVVDVTSDPSSADDQPFTVVDLGQPYFSDLSPDGERAIAHVGDAMRFVDVDGDRTPLDVRSASHQTPAWHPTDDTVFFTRDTGASNELVSYQPATDETVVLATFDGFLLFDLAPDGSQLAVSVFDADGGADDDVVALRTFRRQDSPPTIGGGLWVVGVEGQPPIELAPTPTSAPMWDPTGSHVLARDSLRGGGTWSVYDADGGRIDTDVYDVDRSLLSAYLPFWDQYTRSQTLWSPTGSHFVHAGRSTDGVAGVWVHDAKRPGSSTLLAAGDLAFWSPT